MSDEHPTYSVSTVRRRRRKAPTQPVTRPQHVYDLVAPLVKDATQEHFYALYLNTRNVPIGLELVSVGSLNASIVHPREVYAPALQLRAANVIVAHNHPSGETDPSADDLVITKRLAEAGEVLGIPLLDHVIVSNGDWSSLKDEGHL